MDARRVRRALLFGALAAGSAASVRAQAWLPPQGEASLTFGYGNVFSTKHYFGTVNPGETDAGHIRGQSLGLNLGYAVTNRFALDVSLPLVVSKWYATTPAALITSHGPLDNGQYHATFQDFRINVAYQILNGEVALTPFFTAVIPSHSYTFFAHSAAGKDLHQYLLGFSLGARLDRLVAGSYAQVSYDYAFVDPVLGININRSDFGFEAGYFVTPTVSVRFLGVGYYTHGGLEFHQPPDLFGLPNGDVLFMHHDQIGKSSEVNIGGGMTYLLTGSIEVYASYVRSVYGRDGHKIDSGISFGVAWSFSPQQLVRRYFPPKRASNSD